MNHLDLETRALQLVNQAAPLQVLECLALRRRRDKSKDPSLQQAIESRASDVVFANYQKSTWFENSMTFAKELLPLIVWNLMQKSDDRDDIEAAGLEGTL